MVVTVLMAFGVWKICGCDSADGVWCVGNLWL